MEDNEPSKVGFERRLSALESVLEKISNVVDNVLKENRDRETRLLRKMDSVFLAINGLAESWTGFRTVVLVARPLSALCLVQNRQQ